ncbi:MAG: hypothetical protein NT030_05445 [Candidatus Saganbacteria bacterium]|nr:hypothetical protein [Candidatus Saganbacteria bacterium]
MRIVSGLIILILCLYSGAAFGLSISVNTNTVDFGSADPGTWVGDLPPGPDGLLVSCEAGSAWALSVSSSPLSTGVYSIADEYFHYWGWTVTPGEASSTFINRNNGHDQSGFYNYLTSYPFTIYSSDPADITRGYAVVHVQFGVFVPQDAIAGSYSSDVTLTLTE